MSFAYFNYTVPQGRVGILRGYRWDLEPAFLGLASSDVIGRLMVGAPIADNGAGVIVQRGIDVPEYTNLRHGMIVAEYQPCYVIAGPGETIGLLIELSVAVPLPTTADIEFYGNLLQSTGRPTAFEPGTVPTHDVKVQAEQPTASVALPPPQALPVAMRRAPGGFAIGARAPRRFFSRGKVIRK